MKVICTHLAMRFYTNCGWTQKILDSVTIKGKCHMPFQNDERPYFVPEVGTVLDIKKLMAHVTEVVRMTPGDGPGLTDEQYLEEYNW